jgi:DNA-directed RNA polymerase II subunit RPB1
MINTQVMSSKYQLTQLENDKENYNPLLIEELQTAELNSISSNIGKMILDSMSNTNGFKILVNSGAKGSTVNIAQISGCIGQVVVEGQRIKKKITGRTLPIFFQDDNTPKARGFVKSNLLDGLNGHEFFFHTMAGREGLIDTAIRTAETGYIQRKIVKNLEDLVVKYDSTVRLAHGSIIQFIYGENGVDQTKQTTIKLNIINMNNKDINEKFLFSDKEMSKLKKYKDISNLNKTLEKEYKNMRDMLRNIYFISTGNYKVIEDEFNSTVNFTRLIQDYEQKKESSDLDPNYIISSINDLLTNYDDRLISLNNKNIGISKILDDDEAKYKFLFKISLYEYLCPKKCIFEYGLSMKDFDKLMKDIKLSFVKGTVEPGETVGVIAAQSIGEPTSQMTLNTKHSAGVASKSSANMGVPRIKEIMNYSKDISSPQCIIYLDNKYNKDKHNANNIASYFKYLTIGKLIDSAEIFYDNNSNDSISEMIKNDKTSNPFFINNQKTDLLLLPFVFRFKMNDEKMLDKETSLLDIKTKFITYWYKNFSNIKIVKKNYKDIISKIDKLAITSNNDNIIHIRFKMNDFTYSTLTTFLKIVMNVITLKGIDNIEDIDISHERHVVFNENGDTEIEKEYVIITSGINIPKINEVKGIDHSRIHINDIHTVFKYYGIEAARKVILDELVKTYNDGGAGVNYTHLSLLVDFMTHLGEIISIDRHGLNKVNIDPLTRASFEKIMEYFVNAALYNETDNMKCISSNIMVGRVIPGGTGAFNLLLDTEKIKKSEYIDDETGGRSTFIPLEKEFLFEDLINNENLNVDFFVPE